MVRINATQIFPQNATFPTFPPYPYLPSMCSNQNFDAYYLVNYFPFQPFLHNITVQANQNASILNPNNQNNVKLQNPQPSHPLFLPSTNPINATVPPLQPIIYLRNRNVLPNNVSLILCFVRRVKKSGKMVEKIISKLASNQLYNSKRFYSYQLYLKENYTDFKWKQGIEVLTNYIDPNCASFGPQQQQFYNKVCRILILTYLQRICLLQVLNHSKINKSYIEDHLKVIRYIKECLKTKFKSKITIKYQ